MSVKPLSIRNREVDSHSALSRKRPATQEVTTQRPLKIAKVSASLISRPVPESISGTSAIVGKQKRNVCNSKPPVTRKLKVKVGPIPKKPKAAISRTAEKKNGFVSKAASGTLAASGTSAAAGGKQKINSWDLRGRLELMTTNLKKSQEREAVLKRKCEAQENDRTEMASLYNALKLDNERKQGTIAEINLANERAMEVIVSLEDDARNNLSTIAETKQAYERVVECIGSLEAEVRSHTATIAENRARIRMDEMTRRKLHNTIQELRGNIRVFCRVRPLLQGEMERFKRKSSVDSHGSSRPCLAEQNKRTEPKLKIEFPDSSRDGKKINFEFCSNQPQVTGTSAADSKSYTFEFDRTFGPTSTQDQIFPEISQLVQSALDGYNVCIFAYGQTGSGKTFTMEGPERRRQSLAAAAMGMEIVGDDRGMIPRAMEQIFQSVLSLHEDGWENKLEASFLEIYNETIRDLLATSSSSLSHDIKMDPSRQGHAYVTNVTPVVVTSQEQVAELLERASRHRVVASTKCNERSSRSHSVFRLLITGNNTLTEEKCRGSLNLIDLAGSERLAQSGSVGERMKETKNINKSLSNLRLVIMALGNKDSHVPYRNSKLTHLLQNCLGGNSKTLMFVNMSPSASCFQESLCSLRFATMVNECNIGTARKSK